MWRRWTRRLEAYATAEWELVEGLWGLSESCQGLDKGLLVVGERPCGAGMIEIRKLLLSNGFVVFQWLAYLLLLAP